MGLRKSSLLTSVAFFVVLGGLVTFNSCKFGYSFTGASIPVEAQTVSVDYFESQASLASPSLSQVFTETLRDMMVSQTNLSLTSKNADLTFAGTIVSYNTAPVAIQSNDQAAQNRLTITVKVKYENRFDKSKNFESNFSRFVDYESSQTLSAVEAELNKEISDQIVLDVFNKALNNW